MRSVWCAVLIGLTACGCVTSSYNPATHTQDYSLTSTSKEVAVGRRIAQRITEELPIVEDEPLQERVRAIGSRIAAVCDRQELIYSFTVVQDDEVNAFSLPGGYVFINDGLIKKTATDDELAGVIAHEVAHITARHAVKRFEGGLGLQIAQLATMAARQGAAARGLGVAARAAQLAYARQDELDADRLAVTYLTAAGFNPQGILTFLEKLQGIHRGTSHYLPRGVVRPQYGLTHPYIPERLRAVKESLFGVADYIDYLNAPD